MSRHLMQNAALAGKEFVGATKFPTGIMAKPDVCHYQVDANGLAAINTEDVEAATKAGFKPYETGAIANLVWKDRAGAEWVSKTGHHYIVNAEGVISVIGDDAEEARAAGAADPTAAK